MAENKVRFIQMQIEEKIKLHKREITDINRELMQHKFTPQSYFKAIKEKLEANMKTNTAVDVDEEGEETKEAENEEAKKSLKKSFATETDDEEC
jgi:hypothetical protein